MPTLTDTAAQEVLQTAFRASRPAQEPVSEQEVPWPTYWQMSPRQAVSVALAAWSVMNAARVLADTLLSMGVF